MTDDLDSLTKDELLDVADERGVEVKESWTKAEIREAIEDADEPQVEPAVTTTMTKDFLGRLLINPTPGTSQATDYLGRSVVVTNRDYMARSLVP